MDLLDCLLWLMAKLKEVQEGRQTCAPESNR